jgi:hypothetical protein
MAAALGTNVKVGLGSTSTVDQPVEVLSESIALQEQFIDPAGLRGTRSHPSERVRRGTRQVAGTIVACPTPLEWDYWLPKIAGGTKTVNTIDLAETLPSFYVAVDRQVKVPVYSGCVVSRATLSAAVGGPLQLSVDILGIDESVGAAASFPSLSFDVTGGPYVLSDLALSVGGTTYQCFSFELTVDNVLQPEWFNSEAITRISATDRAVGVVIDAPYGDASALHGTALAGVALSAVFTNSTRSLTITAPAVQAPRNSATSAGRGEIMLRWAGVARKSGSTAECSFVNDSTV